MSTDGDEAEDLSKLVGGIYDAVLDPTLWPTVLEQACAFVGGCSANIYWQDAVHGRLMDIYSWQEDPDYLRLYKETYAKLNPFLPAVIFLEPGVVFAGSDLISHEEFVATRFYKEWVEPQGFIDVIGANLERSPTSSAMFAMRRGVADGLVDAEARRRMSLIVPHVRRAALVGQLIDQKKLMTETLTATMSGVAAAVFLVDAEGRIVFANPPGQDLLEAGHVLREAEGKLVAADLQANQRLGEIIAAAGRGDAALGVGGIAVRLSASLDAPWVATVLPLTSGIRQHAAATAAIFVRHATVDVPAAVARAAELYGLTPAEARVLQAVIEKAGIAPIASALGSSPSTVKTHLESLFAKTGARRQAELVKLIVGFDAAVPQNE